MTRETAYYALATRAYLRTHTRTYVQVRAGKEVNASFSRSFTTNVSIALSTARNRKRYRNFEFGHGGQWTVSEDVSPKNLFLEVFSSLVLDK